MNEVTLVQPESRAERAKRCENVGGRHEYTEEEEEEEEEEGRRGNAFTARAVKFRRVLFFKASQISGRFSRVFAPFPLRPIPLPKMNLFHWHRYGGIIDTACDNRYPQRLERPLNK